ncbi:RdgB/HAM1 family non-canonical purine NTP pyrophosphatase [Streptomyces sp.]|uniref:RdgB/HAM1 family non-canonical purine NTP pyrophosphatase n=1 Tax=Streptomyces sp. TaxID=1931 RepID=UPI002D77DBAD|nr:RdgB/HAM1 family non-canonical purine NTP pyrophosphatase [Streptomyces sp.]HET6355407.1 RdgB/HAM1 family non-canonical purine NTP pyrophosphatase [Streptomyces sp.]
MEGIALVTKNAGKAREFERILGVKIQPVSMALPELQELDVVKVAERKAALAFAELNRPVLVDDSGLVINAWNGLPGALVSWFLDSVGNAGIIRMMAGWPDRSARVVTAIGYCDEGGTAVFEGAVTGHIASEEAGTNGFGYDPIFIPAGCDRTFAQLTDEEKDSISMRRRALDKARSALKL